MCLKATSCPCSNKVGPTCAMNKGTWMDEQELLKLLKILSHLRWTSFDNQIKDVQACPDQPPEKWLKNLDTGRIKNID